MESFKRQPTEKMKVTKRWIDEFIKDNSYPPTYTQIAKHFEISRTAAYARIKHDRDIMRQRI